MPSFTKNSLCLLLLGFVAACDNVTITNPTGTFTIKSDTALAIPSFTILQSGLPPPILYTNAEDIVARRYNIKNIFAAGCIVSESLADSIETYNMATFHEMNKYYRTDMREVVYSETEKEYAVLKQLDSVLKTAPELKNRSWTNRSFSYFIKRPGSYTADFIVDAEDKKSSERFLKKLKLEIVIDSSSKKIQRVTEKDSLLQTDLIYLQP